MKIFIFSALFFLMSSAQVFAVPRMNCTACTNFSKTCILEDDNGLQSKPFDVECESPRIQSKSSDYGVYKTGFFSSGKHHCRAYCYGPSTLRMIFGFIGKDYYAITGSGDTIGEAWSDMVSSCSGRHVCTVSNDGCWAHGRYATMGNSCE